MLTAIYNHPENGYHPIEELEVGKEYAVELVAMGGSYTDIFLEGFPHSFNSVNFDFFKDGKPHDIYRDPNYNPHLGWMRGGTAMAKLKPCPFCGGGELSEAQTKHFGMSARYTIKCLKCMGEMTRTTKQKAEDAWNRRAEDGQQR